MAKIILVTGGCRSGKSGFAIKKAESLGKKAVFVATAEPFDAEMAERIERHKRGRNREWGLIEEPVAIAQALHMALSQTQVALLDCLTIWTANLMHHDAAFSEEKAALLAQELVTTLAKNKGTVIFVTNEVGWGIVPDDPMTRLYRDCAGRINQIMAAAADDVYLCVCGIAQKIK